MNLSFVPTMDARLIARLNRSIHEHHVELNPDFFASYEEEEMYEAFLTLIGKPDHHFILIQLKATPIGYIWFEEKVSEANAFRHAVQTVYIHHMSIDSAYQRNGYGRLVMAWVEDWAKAHHFESVELDYWAVNEQAAAFYEELGFLPKRHIVSKSLERS